MLEDGGRLENAQVQDTVELDEIFTAFDPETRQAFRDWVKELPAAIKDGRGQDLNDAFGNFEGFAVDGATLMTVLDEQSAGRAPPGEQHGPGLRRDQRAAGRAARADHATRRTFAATASRDKALAETFAIFPTFLDESKATMARLEDFSRSTHPLVNDLGPGGDDLGPTVRDRATSRPTSSACSATSDR